MKKKQKECLDQNDNIAINASITYSMMEVYILNSYQLVFADETGHIDQPEGSKYDENQDRVEYTAVLKTVDGKRHGTRILVIGY